MNELQQELISSLTKYCKDNIAPYMEKDDEEGKFRMEIFQGLGQLGLGGITLPEKWGGAELGYEDFVYVLATLGGFSVSYAVTLSVSTMVQSILNEFGTEGQKKKFLPKLTSGEGIGAFALSESSSGSDAASLKCKAKKVKGGYELTGNKMWITSGGIAETYIVMARTGNQKNDISAFIVPNGSKGFTFGKLEKKMGWKTSPTRELVFDKCFVSEENLLSKEGDGFKIAMSALDRGRITIGAIAYGLSEMAISESTKYALERKQFGQAIFDFQGLQFMLSDMATMTEASKQLVLNAARLYDQGKGDSKLASMAKLYATDTAMKVTTDGVQILGGVGYTAEFPLERYMRDAKVLQIVEGTNQIQRVVIARHLKKQFS